MDQHTYKRAIRHSAPSESPKSAPSLRSIPNSSRLGEAGGTGGSAGDLEARLRARIAPKPQAQIASAESEAERLSSGVTATTPEGVKAELGRKLGADFSGVRLHVGGDAEAKAARMGARAFTAGNDVYFGPGGFDPAVAAHELVHTAQQGAVTGAAIAVSAPFGGTQKLDFRFWRRKKPAAAPAPAAVPASTAAASGASAPAPPARHTSPQRTPPPVPPRPALRAPAKPAPAPSSAPATGASAPAPPARHTPPQRTPPPGRAGASASSAR